MRNQCLLIRNLRTLSDTGTVVKLETKRSWSGTGAPAFTVRLMSSRVRIIPRGVWRPIAPDSIALEFTFEDTGTEYRFQVQAPDSLHRNGSTSSPQVVPVGACK